MSNLSNSKLTQETGQTRRDYLRWLQSVGGSVFSFPMYGVTVALRPSGETGFRVAVSVTGADEKKFRRKVGEFLALDRLSAGESVYTAAPGQGQSLESWAEELAALFGDDGYYSNHDAYGVHYDAVMPTACITMP